MTIRKIAQMGHPLLRQPAGPVDPEQVTTPQVQSLIDDMIETMRDAHGAGLAAPQVHVPLRICVIEVADNLRYPSFPPVALTVLINPRVQATQLEQAVTLYEGCLSISGIRGQVRRAGRVQLRALGRQGEPIELDWTGAAAAIVQHEVDHLDGSLFVDRADTTTLAFLTEYERFVPTSSRIQEPGPSS